MFKADLTHLLRVMAHAKFISTLKSFLHLSQYIEKIQVCRQI